MSQSAVPPIPGPRGGVLAGNEPAFRRDPPGFLRACQQQFGDVFRYSRDVVVSTHPGDIQNLLARTNRESFPDPAMMGNHGAPTDESTAQWTRARALAWQALKPHAVAPHIEAIDTVVQEQLRALAGSEVEGQACAEVCVRAALPVCTRDPAPALAPVLTRASRAIIAVPDLGLRLPWWLPSRRRRHARAAGVRVAEQMRALMSAHTEAPPGCPRTVADHAVPHTAGERALATTMLASSEVPGTALAWLVYELGRRPAEQALLRQEATGVSAVVTALGRGSDPAQLLPRTHAFVQETLRLNPPNWLMSRQLTEDIALGSWRVPTGHTVVFSPYLAHRDSRWWSEAPEDFRPGRWLRPAPPHTPHAYFPFGAGPRVCFGAHLGRMILTLAAAHLAASYHLHLRDPDRVRPRFGVPLTPHRLRFRLEHR